MGCSVYVGCIAYADDMILLSSSVNVLQKMLNVCTDCGRDLDILFNAQKSCLFKVGTAYKDHIGNLKIGEQIIKWGDSLKYLGVQEL